MMNCLSLRYFNIVLRQMQNSSGSLAIKLGSRDALRYIVRLCSQHTSIRTAFYSARCSGRLAIKLGSRVKHSIAGLCTERSFTTYFIFVSLLFLLAKPVQAIELSDLPKFRSLKVSEANIRSGPGTSFPVKWVYIKKHIVLEIVDAYDNWYKIRDEEGRSGWLHKSLVSRKRFFVVKVEGAKLYRNPNDNLITYFLEQGIRGKLKNCRDKWCKVTVGKESGWVLKSSIWGVYAHETF